MDELDVCRKIEDMPARHREVGGLFVGGLLADYVNKYESHNLSVLLTWNYHLCRYFKLSIQSYQNSSYVNGYLVSKKKAREY